MKRTGHLWKIFWKLPYSIRYALYKNLNRKGFDRALTLRTTSTSFEKESSLEGFDRLRCIFVHVPKAGGISVNQQLFGNMGGSHMTIKDYSLLYNVKEFRSYYKFSVVRNPIDRLASAYFFLQRGGINESDKMFYDQNLSQYPTFESFVEGWVSTDNVNRYIHFIPQFHFLTIDGKLEVDELFKLEDIETAFPIIAHRLGLHYEKLERKNTSPTNDKKNWNKELNKELREKIKAVYEKDFELLNYSL